jgi:hypothetical protein
MSRLTTSSFGHFDVIWEVLLWKELERFNKCNEDVGEIRASAS